ncbi:hypothetical protein Xind_01828 [Xenorhabdus indica]|nr:hypothetical protein [Xenorhabdus indica]
MIDKKLSLSEKIYPLWGNNNAPLLIVLGQSNS